MNCPFCKTELHRDAVICPGCGARKGFTSANGVVYGRGGTIAFGIALPLVLGLAPLLIFGPNLFVLGWIVIMAIPAVFSWRRLNGGPRWFVKAAI
ncbi:DUF2207 domain-containing protein [Propylenella binzhouense]|uniref:Zinc ribbon domain-containing protein n=1 Tax=Propylenella binzhouense TaxID=2555902 RepID=A0A964T8D2_9HYPH|nr:DUF2207 domain-containing protein [Propylenella binzhouense]MYZ49227.1 hypothetical protein [Propylenella binzhouense]